MTTLKPVPNVTIIITQRERFSYTQASLESLYSVTQTPFNLIYVDGNSPNYVKRYLEKQAKLKGFQLIRKNHYLAPNQARNLAIPLIETDYIIFCDNDVIFQPNWLQNLLDCAQETQAWIVGPLYLESTTGDLKQPETIHMAGGHVAIQDKDGSARFHVKHDFPHRPLAKHEAQLKRTTTELIEFHCFLITKAALETVGGLDPQYLSTGEHWDLCLKVRQQGGQIYLEPSSRITYVAFFGLKFSDLPYYNLRWCDEWNLASTNHFIQQWHLDPKDPHFKVSFNWLMGHRHLALKTIIYQRLPLKKGLGKFRKFLHPLEKLLSQFLLSQSKQSNV